MSMRSPAPSDSSTTPVALELAELESTLVDSAATTTVEAFEREVGQLTRILSRDDGTRHLERLKRQRRVRRWIDRQSGMCHTHLELDPETDARVSAAFDAAVQRPAPPNRTTSASTSSEPTPSSI